MTVLQGKHNIFYTHYKHDLSTFHSDVGGIKIFRIQVTLITNLWFLQVSNLKKYIMH